VTTLATFIYPDACPYLAQWVASANAQDTDIEVVVFSDGVPNAASHFKTLRFPFTVVPVSGSIAGNRAYGFSWLKTHASETIVFQDADDMMSANRVSVCAEYLEDFDLVVNDLSTIDAGGNATAGKSWSSRLGEGFTFGSDFIRRWNIVGFGNAAIRKSLLSADIKTPEIFVPATDWFLFFQLMENANAKAVFTGNCLTLYRQHDANLAGVPQYSEAAAARSIEVKKAHYAALQAAGYDFQAEIADIYAHKKNPNPARTLPEGALFWWEASEFQ
jgi:hypothetical protein